jgi:hypothetical protein
MEVSERHARTRAIMRDTVSPGNQAMRGGHDASRDVAGVVSDVSVLCPRNGASQDNSATLSVQTSIVGARHVGDDAGHQHTRWTAHTDNPFSIALVTNKCGARAEVRETADLFCSRAVLVS